MYLHLHLYDMSVTGGARVAAQAVFSLRKLRLLAIRASGLHKLTAEIAAFPALRRLDVSRNRELDVQDDIPWPAMTALRSLDLSECRHLRVRARAAASPASQQPSYWILSCSGRAFWSAE